MSIESVRSKEIFSNLSITDTGSDETVPEWLKASRARSAAGTATKHTDPASVAAPPPAVKAAAQSRPKSKPKPPSLNLQITDSDEAKTSAEPHWFAEWLKSNNAIGVATSFGLHSLLLITLAFIIMHTAAPREVMNLWGTLGDGDETGSETLIDTVVPVDAGESAPLASDMSQTWESIESGMAALPETGRIGFGAKGHGAGEAGDGLSIGVPSVGIPGHAQRKGNFAAWTEPRDPKPNERYEIVIQVRLPANAKKLRGSDLRGLVTGTDAYRQEIIFKSNEEFPIENGIVEVRVTVPGGDLRVRDTIQIRSKLLREKQTFEIEF